MRSDNPATPLPLRRSRRLRDAVKSELVVDNGNEKKRARVKAESVAIKSELDVEGLVVKKEEELIKDVKVKNEMKEMVMTKDEVELTDMKTKPDRKVKKRTKRKSKKEVADIEDCCLPTPDDVEDVIESLTKMYGAKIPKFDHPKTKADKPVLDSLVATILSQNTTNSNSTRAFRSLKEKFPTWEDALQADPKDLEESIRSGGLAQIKAGRIHAILKTIRAEHGKLDLEYIREMDDEKAKEVLCTFNGVGPKTAACVLMFNMGRGEFPVDTHVRRLTARFGWIPDSYSREKVYQVLNKLLEAKHKYSLHVLLVTHGRRTCKPTTPRCDECPLSNKCQYAKANGGSDGDISEEENDSTSEKWD